MLNSETQLQGAIYIVAFTGKSGNSMTRIKELIPLIIIAIVAVILWQVQPPSGLNVTAYHTAIVFIATIAGIICNVLPTGATALVGLTAFILLDPTGAGSSKGALTIALRDFNHPLIWLIVIATLLAKAFATTGLGERIALLLLSKFGQSTLRVAYCLGVADFLIAPGTPSNTARASIMAPIADSLAKVIDKDDKKLGQFLISSSSAMNDASAVGFSTGFAGNAALVGIALSVAGVTLDFATWSEYLLVPALALLISIPFVLYKTISPATKETPKAPEFAKQELAKLKSTTAPEWILLGTFIAMIIMWVTKPFGMYTTVAAFIGLSVLIITNVLSWNDVKNNSAAWDTFFWFATLMGMANNLKGTGFSTWVGHSVAHALKTGMVGASPTLFLMAMMALYLISAYLFASGTAKVMALGPVVIGALMTLGVSPIIAVLAVAGITNVGCNLSTYSHARNPIMMGYGYHTSAEWMKIGLVIAISSAVVFMSTGMVWWSILGL
ncbi:anion permease [Vibrio neonatus]|uniref:anion permease n=1 Tax=Vibrio neonatus TaxID=278860 RepID=UPI0021C28144|nr:anion permease [Vibrio neonatus]